MVTGTSSSYSVGTGGGNREDLEDVIHDLFPEDTWALSNLDKVSASATFHEWLGDEPAAAAANITLEGDDATFATIANPARYGNHTQIFNKTFVISGTQEVVNKAGRKSEISRQAMKQMRELKRDVEYALTRNQAGTAGSATVGRSLGSMESWIGATAASATAATAVVLTTAAASSTTAPVTSGAPGAPTDTAVGSTAAFTEAALKLALEGAWDKGGDTDVLLMTPSNKNVLNDFTGIATRNVDVGQRQQATITGAADVYVSSFGVHKVVQHRYMRNHAVLCLDSSMWAIASLRGFTSERLAKTGDAQKRLLQTELTLVARNWKANSKVVGMGA
jgi:hypothetical protein